LGNILRRFGTIPNGDRQRDEQISTFRQQILRLCITSRG